MKYKSSVIIFFASILVIYISMHLYGIHIPYHQDEYKWVQYAHPEIIAPGTVPHPPLTEFIYTKIAPMFGDSNFRAIPTIFGFINILLLFFLVENIFKNRKKTYFILGLYIVSFFSLLASLMVDVDGTVMPFFFLILSIGYYKFKESSWMDYRWILLLLIGAVGGFFIKVSAVLPILAFALDFAIEKKLFADKKRLVKYAGGFLGLLFILVLLLVLSKYIFPFFNLEYSLKYWEHFANSSSFFGRGWLQTFIQLAKSILYLSPLLILPLFFISKEIYIKTRVFFIFIVFGLSFYLFIFDFSIGAIDRYLQFLVIPLCILSGAIYQEYFREKFINKKIVCFFLALSAVLFAVQFLPNFVPPLYPKTEYIHRILSLKWNFLYPFSGGSGPLAFYVSFAFIGLSWITAFILVIITFFKKFSGFSKRDFLLGVFVIGLVYNSVFIEEYLFGNINGNSSMLVKDAALFIKNNPDIKMVTVYNDNGGWDIQAIGKYRKRLYIDPKFDVNAKLVTLNQYKEHYMVVDIPKIDSSTIYQKYFDSCSVVYHEVDKNISATVYDCRKSPDLKL